MLWHSMTDGLVLSGIPGSTSENVLEESVISVLADIDFLLNVTILRLFIGLASSDRDKSQKTTVRFVNRKNIKKV